MTRAQKARAVQSFAAAAAGASIALAGAPREWSSLGFVGPALLLLALEVPTRPSPRRAFALGVYAGAVTNLIALYWIVGLLERFGGFPWIAALLVGALLWVAQSITFGLACAGASALASRGVPTWLTLPATLVVCIEWVPFLFPWPLAGTQAGWPTWIQMAEIGGEPLVALMVALTGCALGQAALRLDRVAATVAIAAFTLPVAYGHIRLQQVRTERAAAPRVRIGVVQPNVSIENKRDRRGALARLAQLHRVSLALERRGAELVVWPETAYPYAIGRDQARDRSGVLAVRPSGGRVPLLVGAITARQHERYNSVIAIEADGRISGIADKVELLAFGEYVPLWDYLPPLQAWPRGLIPGPEAQVLDVGPVRAGVLNCYEDVLPEHARRVAQRLPDVLVNVTNDAWFGDTTEPWLHQAVARLRSVETRRDMVRAVNTGVSSHTAATGEDMVRTGTFEAAAFVADVRVLGGVTPWVRFGDMLTPALAGMLLGTLLALARRKVAW